MSHSDAPAWKVEEASQFNPPVEGNTGTPIQFFHLLSILKTKPRTGWVRNGIPSPAESIVGDITPMDPVSKSEKNRREVTTIDFLANKVLAGVPGHGTAELEAVWNEFEAGETEEAKFAQDLDKFEMLLQAVEYERLMAGEEDLSSFITVVEKIQLSEVKAWAEVVIKERNSMWESWAKTPATVGEETKRQLDAYYGRYQATAEKRADSGNTSQPSEELARIETPEGRVLYLDRSKNGTLDTTWTHPNPDFRPESEPCNQSAENSNLNPGYEALSYTWGSAKNPENAYVHEASVLPSDCADFSLCPSTTICLSRKLASALKGLRYKSKIRTLWVDSICINQDDNEERSIQVSRMNEIYWIAARVVVWLGPENNELAISTLKELGSKIEITRDKWYLPAPGSVSDIWWVATHELPYNAETWESIYRLLNSTWFDRVWVIQEIQLASPESIIICGEDEIPWSLLRRALLCIFFKGNNLPIGMRERLSKMDLFCLYRLEQALPALLNLAVQFTCTNPRDKVYGMLGLAPPKIACKLRPNYLLSEEEVYKMTLLEYSMLVNRLDLLGSCNIKSRIESAPSWVPNWAVPSETPCLSRLNTFTSSYAPAYLEYRAPNILEIAGLSVGTICTVQSSHINTESDVFEILQNVGVDRLRSDSYVTGEPLLDAYALTFSLQRVSDRFTEFMKGVVSMDDLRKLLLTAASGTILDSRMETQLRLLLLYIKGCKFFHTANGSIGLGPQSTKPGDTVWTVLGCRNPLVLRAVSTSCEPDEKTLTHFAVIGECYFHGIMNGESLLGPLPTPWEFRFAATVNVYWNTKTKSIHRQDPRLDQQCSDWEEYEVARTADDPLLFYPHRNKITDEIINYDPRLSYKKLLGKGVALERIILV